MASRLKEDEKNERIIRGISKLPANRRCINCNSLGPQYVCTNFATFICTNCSGIHREFTHRVKSISMAKFTPQEISSLQEGGNERAKEIFFKEWDFQRQSCPDSSDVERLRDFIKHVYVDRRFTGERSVDKTPRFKGEREDSYRGGSRSPPYQNSYENREDNNNNNNNNNSNKTPANINGSENRESENPRFPEGGNMLKPANTQRDSMGPASLPVREILGVGPPVRIPEPPKSNKPNPIIPAPAQSTASASTATNQTPATIAEPVTAKSLIDFDSDPEPVPKQQTGPPPNHINTNNNINSNNNNNESGGWASFDTTVSAAPQKATSVVHTLAPGPGAATTNFSQASNTLQQQNRASLFPAPQSINPQLNRPPVVGPTGQMWGAPVAPPNALGFSIAAPNGQVSQPLTGGPHANSSLNTAQPSPSSQAVPSGRKALPEDLFSMIYAQVPVPSHVPAWQMTPHGMMMMGYGMQYPTPHVRPALAHPSQPINPFDVTNEPNKLTHASTFPSLTSLQGALPNMNMNSNYNSVSSSSNPMAMSRNLSMGSQWAPPPPQQQQQPPYLSRASPYLVQQNAANVPQQLPINTIHPGNQMMGGFGFNQSGLNPQYFARNPQHGNPNSFPPVGGNPFA